MFDIFYITCHNTCRETTTLTKREKWVNYFEFKDKNISTLDIIATCDNGYVRVEAVVVDGETEYTDEEYDGETGILYVNEDEEVVFLPHYELFGLETEGY